MFGFETLADLLTFAAFMGGCGVLWWAFSALTPPEPCAETKRLAAEIARLATGEVHESQFPGREDDFRAAEREGVVESLSGAWSYESDGWFRLTKRGRELAA